MHLILDIRELEKIHEETKNNHPEETFLIEKQKEVIVDGYEVIKKNTKGEKPSKDEDFACMISGEETHYFPGLRH